MVSDEELSQAFRQLIITFHQMKHRPDVPKERYQGKWRILSSLKRQGDISQRDLAELVAMKPGSLTEALEHMEDDHLVVRKRDASDRRIVRVSITPKGIGIQEKMTASAQDFESKLFSALDPTERDQLLNILDKLTHRLLMMKEKCSNG